jgi:methylated-DNA-protein-cysteine methyltransferase-like protein
MASSFTSPPDPKAFNHQVWEIVRQIPAGQVSTYGQIAAMIPPPPELNLREYESMSPRWVGGAMAACPEDVPWQRVINSQGKISVRRGGGQERQRERLEEEGVTFDEHGRVDLSTYGWRGPSPEWLAARHFLPPPVPPGSQPKLF